MKECYICLRMHPDRDVVKVDSIRGGKLDLFVCKNCKDSLTDTEKEEFGVE